MLTYTYSNTKIMSKSSRGLIFIGLCIISKNSQGAELQITIFENLQDYTKNNALHPVVPDVKYVPQGRSFLASHLHSISILAAVSIYIRLAESSTLAAMMFS